MADHENNTRRVASPGRSATLDDFTQQLSEARIIADIVIALAEASLNSTAEPSAGIYAWLGDELDTRLERVEVAGQTLRVRGACA